MNDAVQICRDNDCACCEVLSVRRCSGCSYWARRGAASAQEAPSLSDLNELAKVYAYSYASPHHIVFTVDGLRNLIAAHKGEPIDQTDTDGVKGPEHG
jgi:hypothetical protein